MAQQQATHYCRISEVISASGREHVQATIPIEIADNSLGYWTLSGKNFANIDQRPVTLRREDTSPNEDNVVESHSRSRRRLVLPTGAQSRQFALGPFLKTSGCDIAADAAAQSTIANTIKCMWAPMRFRSSPLEERKRT